MFLQDLSQIIVPVTTLMILLFISLSLLLVTQLPSTLTSAKARLLIGFVASGILGIGALIIRASVPLFITIHAMIAVLPRDTRQTPTIFAIILIIIHLSIRFIFLDHSNYYQIVQVNIYMYIYFFGNFNLFVFIYSIFFLVINLDM